MLYFGGSNPIKYGVLIVQYSKDYVAILNAGCRAVGLIIHALMLAVKIVAIAKALPLKGS